MTPEKNAQNPKSSWKECKNGQGTGNSPKKVSKNEGDGGNCSSKTNPTRIEIINIMRGKKKGLQKSDNDKYMHAPTPPQMKKKKTREYISKSWYVYKQKM